MKTKLKEYLNSEQVKKVCRVIFITLVTLSLIFNIFIIGGYLTISKYIDEVEQKVKKERTTLNTLEPISERDLNTLEVAYIVRDKFNETGKKFIDVSIATSLINIDEKSVKEVELRTYLTDILN